jgi:hypothetical protein
MSVFIDRQIAVICSLILSIVCFVETLLSTFLTKKESEMLRLKKKTFLKERKLSGC